VGRHLPAAADILIAGPTSGLLSDRFGALGIATAGMVVFGASFIGLMLLPVNFSFWEFALITGLNGIGGGMFAARGALSSLSAAHQRSSPAGSSSPSSSPGRSTRA
jgi:MFS family permease